jgi:hypothetical protein
MCRCAAGLHNQLKPCSAPKPPPCAVSLAERCPAGEHTVWRRCCEPCPPGCRAQVHEPCAGRASGDKHLVLRTCCEVLQGCVFCEQELREQEALHKHQEDVRTCVLKSCLSLLCCCPVRASSMPVQCNHVYAPDLEVAAVVDACVLRVLLCMQPAGALPPRRREARPHRRDQRADA